MAIDVAKDIAQFINDNGLASLGTDLFVGPVRPQGDEIPASCIFVRVYNGADPDRTFDNEYHLYNAFCNIVVRVSPDDGYDHGISLCTSIYTLFSKLEVLGYLDVFPTSPIISLDYDINDNHSWSINLKIRKQIEH